MDLYFHRSHLTPALFLSECTRNKQQDKKGTILPFSHKKQNYDQKQAQIYRENYCFFSMRMIQ